jgi:hypothetical protein
MPAIITPLSGDRSAFDMDHPNLHASDIEDGTFIYHKDPDSPSGGASTLDDLTDVNTPTPEDGQVLTWQGNPSGGEWVSADVPTGGTHALDDHTDVNASAPDDGQVLTWNNETTKWIPADLPASGITMDQADPYGLHHRLAGSSTDDDEFSTNTLADWTQSAISGNANWNIANHCANVESWSISSGNVGCILKLLTGWADGHWLETCIRTLGNAFYNYIGFGLILTDGTVGSSHCCMATLWMGTTDSKLNARIDSGTLSNINGAEGGADLNTSLGNGAIRLKFKRVSSTSYGWYAGTENGGIYLNWDGVAFNPGFTPTHGGLFVRNWGASNHLLTSFDYFRHMS